MDLFILSGSNPRIQRVITEKSLQEDIATELKGQINQFLEGKTHYDFDGRYKPDPEELLVIHNFDDIERILDAVQEPDGIPEWAPTEQSITEIKGLFAGVTTGHEVTVVLQAFDKRQILSTSKVTLFTSDDTFSRLKGIGLTLDSKPTAILKTEDILIGGSTLYFSSLHNVRRLFDMDAYYHESTKEEVATFFSDEKFTGFDAGWLDKNLDNWIRKKVTFINQEDILGKCSVPEIVAAAAEFNLTLEVDENSNPPKLKIPAEKRELKELLRFLDEDIYQSPITGNKFRSNSKLKIPVN